MDERTITIILRLIHILAGAFWAGTAFLIAGFLVPTVRATGREGGLFMQHLMETRRLQMFLGIAMLLTVLSGVTMYARLAATTHGAWAGTAPGIAYGVGAVAAILGGAAGAFTGSSAEGVWPPSARVLGPVGPRPSCRPRWGDYKRGLGWAPESPRACWQSPRELWLWRGICRLRGNGEVRRPG
jgi:hypothetical protein